MKTNQNTKTQKQNKTNKTNHVNCLFDGSFAVVWSVLRCGRLIAVFASTKEKKKKKKKKKKKNSKTKRAPRRKTANLDGVKAGASAGTSLMVWKSGGKREFFLCVLLVLVLVLVLLDETSELVPQEQQRSRQLAKRRFSVCWAQRNGGLAEWSVGKLRSSHVLVLVFACCRNFAEFLASSVEQTRQQKHDFLLVVLSALFVAALVAHFGEIVSHVVGRDRCVVASIANERRGCKVVVGRFGARFRRKSIPRSAAIGAERRKQHFSRSGFDGVLFDQQRRLVHRTETRKQSVFQSVWSGAASCKICQGKPKRFRCLCL
jgi:hypothetical protein